MVAITLSPGLQHPFTAIPVLPDGYTPAFGPVFTWTSSNPSVAAADFNTKWVNDHRNVMIRALSLGTSTITCTSGPLVGTIIVSVVPFPSPSMVKLGPGVVFNPAESETQNFYLHLL